MPLSYSSIIDEHLTVRNSVGIFDVSHMGRFHIEGRDAESFLNWMVTSNISRVKDSHIRYAIICNENGGIIDDNLVYRVSSDDYYVVVNAANRIKDFEWYQGHINGYNVNLIDLTEDSFMIAIQGPKAQETLEQIIDLPLNKMKHFSFQFTELLGKQCIVSRTGYTGEDGYEIIMLDTPLKEASLALKLWNMLLEAGGKYGIKPCGLGARDTLRLEAGYVLYDNDININVNPIEARMTFAVDFDHEFIGFEALSKVRPNKVRFSIIMKDRGIPRHGNRILSQDDEVIGEVSSGSYSPLIKNGIGMGYLPKNVQEILIEIRGKKLQATVLPPSKMLKRIRETASQP